jgi:hypothetical protein
MLGCLGVMFRGIEMRLSYTDKVCLRLMLPDFSVRNLVICVASEKILAAEQGRAAFLLCMQELATTELAALTLEFHIDQASFYAL